MTLNLIILLCAVVLILCVFSSKLSNKLGIPTLLLFLALGMLFGSDGIVGISFDRYDYTEKLCSAALVFIMFYGGFGTNWKVGKPVAPQAIALSTAGVFLTSFITGLFCCFVLKTGFWEGMLIGSVIGSTDAASVFSILRSRKLNFKNNIASLLEIESGSNDPTSYMLTVIVVAILEGKGAANIPLMIFSQIFFGILCGVTIAVASVFVLKRINFGSNGLHIVFVIAIALLAYSVPVLIGGNGYLSVYLAGIILGNSRILNKVELVHFFDGVTWLMQILIFFVLGLLSFPSRLPQIFLPALVVFIVLTFIARPIAVFSILSWFKTPFKQQLLVSWAGLRGAASIVFAIYAITNCHGLKNDIFHIVFCVALLSVTFQGTLLPLFAKKLKLIDLDTPVLKTFTDYQDDSDMKLVEIKIKSDSSWVNKALSELVLPDDVLIVMIKRAGKTIIPRGGTVILENDTVVVSADSFENISAGKITSAKL